MVAGSRDTGRSGSAAESLMDAAESLVAQHGSEGVAMSAVIRAAGLRHNSAIAYHFGDWQNLMNAVWTRGSEFVNLRRRKILAECGPDPSLGDLVEIYIVPLAQYLDEQPVSYWARFNEEALRSYPLIVAPELRSHLEQFDEDVPLATLADVFERMQHVMGGDDSAALRVSIVVRSTISTFAAWERDAEKQHHHLTAEQLGETLRTVALATLQSGPEI